MQLLFATNNQNKVKEIQALLTDSFKLLGLNDISFKEDIPEIHDTIEKNASGKAHYIYDRYKINCFADDTGLEVETLGGKPGVMSARYAGEQKNSEENIDKLLKEMKFISDRRARFKTIISLIIDDKSYNFEGIVNGHILKERRGEEGFGYDSVFVPIIDGVVSEKSFAEMSLMEKNMISHRAIAVKKLVEYLGAKYSL
jgi:XTP/dITP diphosphohydrolase